MTSTDHHQQPPADRPDSGLTRWGDAALGAAMAAEGVTAALLRDLRAAAERQQRRLAGLAERGAVERARYRQRAERTAATAITGVTESPLIDRIVDRVVDRQARRVLRPVVRTVLDEVLLLLEKEPDRVRTMTEDGREELVDELVVRLRPGAAPGAGVTGRLAGVLRRPAGREPAPPLDL